MKNNTEVNLSDKLYFLPQNLVFLSKFYKFQNGKHRKQGENIGNKKAIR